jgi:hypothetical protein
MERKLRIRHSPLLKSYPKEDTDRRGVVVPERPR